MNTCMSRNWGLVKHSALFVLGFTIVFAVIGVAIEHFFAQFSYDIKNVLSYVGGVIIIGFGLLLTGLIKIPFLDKERRLQAKNLKYPSATSFFFGAAFGAGWSPCVGAILGAIITLAATQPTNALVFMLAYSAGLGVPFILAGLYAEHAKKQLKHFSKHMKYIQVVLGGLLILLGVMILTNQLIQFANYTAQSALFTWIDVGLANQGVGVGVSFVAGLASFLSPCVLPLLPVYLAYLAGLAVHDE